MEDRDKKSYIFSYSCQGSVTSEQVGSKSTWKSTNSWAPLKSSEYICGIVDPDHILYVKELLNWDPSFS